MDKDSDYYGRKKRATCARHRSRYAKTLPVPLKAIPKKTGGKRKLKKMRRTCLPLVARRAAMVAEARALKHLTPDDIFHAGYLDAHARLLMQGAG